MAEFWDADWVLKQTISVGELIHVLDRYPKDMLCIVTWEGILKSLQEDNIYESDTGCLYIDADENFYKEEFMKKNKLT